MPNIAVVTDSSANLPAQPDIENEITIIPILLSYGGETHEDGVVVQPAELYAWLRANEQVPSTSSPSVGAFLRVFEGPSHRGVNGIASIVPAPRLSRANNGAAAAAGMIGRPPVRVTHTETVAMGFAAVEAARAATAGADLDAAVGRGDRRSSRLAWSGAANQTGALLLSTQLTPIMGAHTGPGVLGVIYYVDSE